MTLTSTSVWDCSKRSRFALLLAAGLVLGACAGKKKETAPPKSIVADMVLHGGTIHTMDVLKPKAEAVAVRRGRIEWVGTFKDIKPLIGKDTQIIDLRGRALTPGLVDAHAHLWGLGKARENIMLRGMTSPRAVADVVAKAVASRPVGEWVVGRGWDQNLFPEGQFPSHRALTTVAPDHPVALRRVDGHALWANAKAMEMAGVGRDTPDPDGGKIMRDSSGQPTGIFVDRAMDLVEGRIPVADEATIERQILLAQEEALSVGLTGVHEMGIGMGTARVYQRLDDEGKLRIRVYSFLGGDGRLEEIRKLGRPENFAGENDDSRFTVRGIKLFADGALGSRGAALLTKYDDDDSQGLLLISKEDLVVYAKWAWENGWQLGVHAIGDKANRLVLDAYEKALGTDNLREARFRIEHAQVVALQDIPRFARLGVIASMQPTHATSDMPWAEKRVGPDRIRGAYAWRSLLKAGVRICFGSDFPVEEPAPLMGVYAAATRMSPKGEPAGGWYPDERVGLDEAFGLFTLGAAWASFQENSQGKIAPGFVADFTIYDRDFLGPEQLLQTRVDMTIIAGKIEYQRDSASQ